MALLPSHHPPPKAACGRSITHLPRPPHPSGFTRRKPKPSVRHRGHVTPSRCAAPSRPLPAALGVCTDFSGSCGKFSFSVLHSLEANISFISREIYLGFAQPRGKYLIYFSRNLSRFCAASRQIAYLFLEKFSFPPHFRWVVGAHGHDRLIRRGVQQSGRNSNSKTKKKRRKKKFEGIEPTSGCLQAGCNTTGPRAP